MRLSVFSALFAAVLAFPPCAPAAFKAEAVHSFLTVAVTPNTGLTKAKDGNYYGTTADGGEFHRGSVFRVKSDGTLETVYSFPFGSPKGDLAAGFDGALYGLSGDSNFFCVTPTGTMTFVSPSGPDVGSFFTPLVTGSDGVLYGAARSGGPSNGGTLFQISTSGIVSRIASFSYTGAAGYSPTQLSLGADGYLYGATTSNSAVFKVSPQGTMSVVGPLPKPYRPEGRVVADGAGNVYGIVRGNASAVLFKMTPKGVVSLPDTPDATRLTVVSDGSIIGVNPTTIFRYWPANGNYSILRSFNYGDSPSAPISLTELPNKTFLGLGGPRSGNQGGTLFRMNALGDIGGVQEFPFETDGKYPTAPLTPGADGYLYGTTSLGGSENGGTFYRVSLDGEFEMLASFSATTGTYPIGPLIADGTGGFYGTTNFAGAPVADSSTAGAVFHFTMGGGIQKIATLQAETHGLGPTGLVKGEDGNFYGVTSQKGPHDAGAFFRVSPAGEIVALGAFDPATTGAHPMAPLMLAADGNFYGACPEGGANGAGTLFRATPQGALTVLAAFDATSPHPEGLNTLVNVSGAFAKGRLVQAPDGNILGVASNGGSVGMGTVFKCTLAGELTVLHTFGTGEGLEGSGPDGGLALGKDGKFYGQTSQGNGNWGSAFRISEEGAFERLAALDYFYAGAGPDWSPLLETSEGWYGTRFQGGTFGDGTIFRLIEVADPEPTPTPGPTPIDESTPTPTPDATPLPTATASPTPQIPGVGAPTAVKLPRKSFLVRHSSTFSLHGNLPQRNTFVEYRPGDAGSFHRAPGGPKWKITTKLKPGVNVIFIRVVDSRTGKKSKVVRVVVLRD